MKIVNNDPSRSELLASIVWEMRGCYGNLGEPDYKTMTSRFRKHPHREIIRALQIFADVTETTDPNNDRSTQLYARAAGGEVAIELSVIGPFAIVRTTGRQPGWHLPGDPRQDSFVAKLIMTVTSFGFVLIDRETAVQKTPMRDLDSDATLSVYEAVFSESATPL